MLSTREERTSDWSFLPNDLLRTIFAHFSLRPRLLVLGRVCKRWLTIARNVPTELRGFPRQYVIAALSILTSVTSMDLLPLEVTPPSTLRHLSISVPPKSNEPEWIALLAPITNLAALDVRIYGTWPPLGNLITRNSQLHALSLDPSGTTEELNFQCADLLDLSPITSLRSLSICSSICNDGHVATWMFVSMHLTQLTSLSLEGGSAHMFSGSSCPARLHLTLREQAFERLAPKVPLSHLPNLAIRTSVYEGREPLIVQYRTAITGLRTWDPFAGAKERPAFYHIVPTLPSLEVLDCYSVGSLAQLQPFVRLRHLHAISFAFVPADHVPALTALTIGGEDEAVATRLTEIMTVLPGLRKLSLPMSDAAIDALQDPFASGRLKHALAFAEKVGLQYLKLRSKPSKRLKLLAKQFLWMQIDLTGF